jgi:hypothetical protein
MSLDSIVLCPPCLSLSLLFVETCVYLGEAVVESPAHSHLRVGGGFIYLSEEASPGGRGRFIYLFIGGPSAGGHDIEWRQAPERCVLAAAGSEQPLLVGGHRVRAVPICALPRDGLQDFGRTSVVLFNVSRQSSVWTILGPLIPVSSEEDFRCSDRDRAGHDSGNSVVPLSTPGPQANRGKTAGRSAGSIMGASNVSSPSRRTAAMPVHHSNWSA